MFSKVLGVLQIAPLLLLIGCVDYSDDQKLKSNSLQIETLILKQNSEGCENNRSGNCAKIKIEYIVLKNLPDLSTMEKINSKIQKELLRPIGREKNNRNFEELMQNFIDEYKNFKKEFPEAQQEWEIERKAVNNFNDDNILSCTFSEYSYLGGAHPNTFLTITNFNLKSGEIIILSDILIDRFLNELNNIAEPIFRKEKELTEDINLTEAGFWFDNDKFSVNNNFTIGKDGLTFFYNNYEITAYAYGPTELFIPYKSIKKLIKPDGLLASLIEN
ncbi:MAG: DUF3298 and DUF4163 domain-containing protein [Bacteroidetes bacterium]|nr:DUF3298 and DUF4163 domain-containing protein [Bacteroidota bacterium]